MECNEELNKENFIYKHLLRREDIQSEIKKHGPDFLNSFHLPQIYSIQTQQLYNPDSYFNNK